jgi:hypothetical protein
MPVLSTSPKDYYYDGCMVRRTRRSTPGIRRLVMLTLVLGTQVGKLYSASTLALSLSASCSWDGGPRASNSTCPEYTGHSMDFFIVQWHGAVLVLRQFYSRSHPLGDLQQTTLHACNQPRSNTPDYMGPIRGHRTFLPINRCNTRQ